MTLSSYAAGAVELCSTWPAVAERELRLSLLYVRHREYCLVKVIQEYSAQEKPVKLRLLGVQQFMWI